MDIVELYENEQFNNLLGVIAERNKIRDFDDYRQDVFLEIIDTNCKNMNSYRKAAQRVGLRYYNAKTDIDIDSLSYFNENGEPETYDETMARLVYHGKGQYV